MPVKKEAAISPKTNLAAWLFSSSVAKTSILEIVEDEVNRAVAGLPAFAVVRESDPDFASPILAGIFEPYLFAYAWVNSAPKNKICAE